MPTRLLRKRYWTAAASFAALSVLFSTVTGAASYSAPSRHVVEGSRAASTPSPLAGRWTNLAVNAPQPASGAAVAWDSRDGLMFSFGGDMAYSQSSDLWAYRPITTSATAAGWVHIRVNGDAPQARAGASMVWDSTDNVLLLFGGTALQREMNELWAYKPGKGGTAPGQWVDLTTDASPLRRAYQSAVWDTVDGVMLVFGGETNGTVSGDAWAYRPARGAVTPGQWLRLPVGPAPRQSAMAAWDATDGLMFLLGGQGYYGYLADLWSFRPLQHGTSGDWTRLALQTALGPRAGAGVAWDDINGRLLVFGGSVPTPPAGTASETVTPTQTHAAAIAPPDPVATVFPSPTPGSTDTSTSIVTATPTPTDSATVTPTPTGTSTATSTGTATPTAINTGTTTDTPTDTSTATATASASGTATATATNTGTATSTSTATITPTDTVTTTVPAATNTPASTSVITSTATPAASGTTTMPVPEARHALLAHVQRPGNFVNTPIGAYADDLWAYTPGRHGTGAGSWLALGSGGPPARSGAAVYDGKDGLLLLYGGSDGSILGDLWAYSAPKRGRVQWTLRDGGSPQARSGHAAAWDARDGLLYVFGGFNGTTWLNDLWTYTAQRGAIGHWRLERTLDATAVAPAPRSGASLVWDDRDKVLLLFGGANGVGALGDTWAFKPGATSTAPGRWIQLRTASAPPARYLHTAVWDAHDRIMLVYGGATIASVLPDLWAFSIDNLAAERGHWRQLTAATGVPARFAQAAVWDSIDARMLVFGGVSSGGQFLGDLLSYSPAADAWRTLGVPNIPDARGGSAAAWDPADHALLIFGGTGGKSLRNDLYAYQIGAGWRTIAASGPLERRQAASLVFDTVGGGMLLFGGTGSAGGLNDLWQLGGAPLTAPASMAPAPKATHGKKAGTTLRPQKK